MHSIYIKSSIYPIFKSVLFYTPVNMLYIDGFCIKEYITFWGAN